MTVQPRPVAGATPARWRSTWARLVAQLRWTRASYSFLIAFALLCGLIVYMWWPLAQDVLNQIDWHGQWWLSLDWLLLGDFAVMTLLLMAGADLRRDALIVLVGACGGLVIESWGTQTHIWTYYTLERPPLWIIPAWPIASLAIDRIVRVLNELTPRRERATRVLYWLTFAIFLMLMLKFVWPTINRTMTLAALGLCLTLIFTPNDYRGMLLTFVAGSALGYFLELWGTTRLCWTYYTHEMPPLFAVLAHGMAAVAFWRSGLLIPLATRWLRPRFLKTPRLAGLAKRNAEDNA
jgi:hypothetical protein